MSLCYVTVGGGSGGRAVGHPVGSSFVERPAPMSFRAVLVVEVSTLPLIVPTLNSLTSRGVVRVSIWPH
jgi:hypothetical protein